MYIFAIMGTTPKFWRTDDVLGQRLDEKGKTHITNVYFSCNHLLCFSFGGGGGEREGVGYDIKKKSLYIEFKGD